jgi:4-oxalomesaconate tautomerase
MPSPATNPTSARCMVMRGGTSKGLYFVESDLPENEVERDRFLLEVIGSPDDRQIDGMGGAHPLTSKVAVVAKSPDADADIEYLFLQVVVDKAVVTDAQNCGNILAGVGPFAVERGLFDACPDGPTVVRIRMVNTGGVAVASFLMKNGAPVYSGDTFIAGVPGTAAPVRIDFMQTAGSSCGSLLPTGNISDVIDGVAVTLIDNGMPVVIIRANDVGVTGYESPLELEANAALRSTIEGIRLAAGHLMGLGDVSALTVPKVTLVAAPRDGGSLCTRTFIPHRCHDAIGVLGAVSVATAALLPGSPAESVSNGLVAGSLVVEHPTGTFDTAIEFTGNNGTVEVQRAGIIRTTRKLMDGTIFGRS